MSVNALLSWGEARRLAMLGNPVRRADWGLDTMGITFPWKVATVSTGTDLLTSAGHGFLEGCPIVLSSSNGDVPGYSYDATTKFFDVTAVYHAVSVSTDSFKISVSGPGGAGVDINDVAGIGTITVRKAIERLWLTYEHGIWWRHVSGLAEVARATDMEAADFTAANWTTLSEGCLVANDALNGELRPTPVPDTLSCSLPVALTAERCDR